MSIRNNTHELQRQPPLESDEVLTENEQRVIKVLIERPGLTKYADLVRSFEIDKRENKGMSYPTVHTTVDRLEAGDYLRKGWTVNFKKSGYEICYRIDVMIDPSSMIFDRDTDTNIPTENPQQVLAARILRLVEHKPFKNWVLIENIEILLGDPADLCVTARVSKHQDIFEFVTRGLRSLPGIRQTSTCQISWSVRDEPRANSS